MIFVLSQRKGGSGKSTIAVNLAAFLLETGMDVGLLDTDQQRSTWFWYQRRQKQEGYPRLPECYFAQGAVQDNIRALAARNDHVIVDTAGFDSNEMRLAIVLADCVIAPFRPKPYDLEQAVSHKRLLEELRIANPKMRIYAILNQCPTNHKDGRADGAQVFLESLGYQVNSSRLLYREAYGDSAAMGLGAMEYKGDQSATAAASEVRKFAQEVLHG